METITQSNNCLLRVSNSIKISNIANQNARAAEFRLEDYYDGKNRLTEDNVRAVFTNIILDISDNLDDNWLQRLIDSMITRLKRILYRRSRQAQWSFQQTPMPTMERSHKPSELQHSLPSVLQQDHSTSITSPRIDQSKPLNPLPSQATELSAQQWRPKILKSEISKATSSPQRREDETGIPPPPKEAFKGNSFTCPYCCLILPRNMAQNHNAWA